MELKKIIEHNETLKFIVDKLELRTGLSRKYLYATHFKTQSIDIQDELNAIEYVDSLFINPELETITSKISIKLEQFKDVSGTIRNISSGRVLDDVELFELKHFSLLHSEVRELLDMAQFHWMQLPSLNGVIDILDPRKQKIPGFYIYDEYSLDLAKLRKELKNLKYQESKSDDPELKSKTEELFHQSLVLEDEIREKLSSELSYYKEALKEAINKIAHLDILISKAELSRKLKLVKPSIAQDITVLNGMFNPQLQEILQIRKKSFQAIDISVPAKPSLITGANMAGKTVLLKTLALVQYLFQFGFYVPATTARIVPVDEVILCVDDEQSERAGLSSFAAEMMNVNTIVNLIHKKKKLLVLIDELARTTNPVEGTAIVASMLEMLDRNNVRSLITTHYGGIETPCRKLRIKGFVKERLTGELTIDNVNDYIDYSLTEDEQQFVPMEALQIAALLNVDASLLERARTLMNEMKRKQ